LTLYSKLLPKNANYYFCNAQISRALPAEKLKEFAEKWSLKGESFISVQEALNKAKACVQPNDIIFIGGSTFTVAEVLP
jgi:dihydrofolate synthase / folylpolyglutamate synthase